MNAPASLVAMCVGACETPKPRFLWCHLAKYGLISLFLEAIISLLIASTFLVSELIEMKMSIMGENS